MLAQTQEVASMNGHQSCCPPRLAYLASVLIRVQTYWRPLSALLRNHVVEGNQTSCAWPFELSPAVLTVLRHGIKEVVQDIDYTTRR